MMRWGGALVVIALMVPALAASAQNESYRDDFGSVSYSNNDGSLDWTASWQETGESDGPASGQVQVVDGQCSNNKCLRMRGGILGAVGISRQADLAGFQDARLQYDLHIDAAYLSTGILYVEARGAGSGWRTLDSYPLPLESGDHTGSFDVTAYAGADFQIRFRLTALLGGDAVYFDRVRVEGVLPAVTTTSTSTTSTSSPTTTSPGSPTSTNSQTTTSSTASGGAPASSTSTVPAGSHTTTSTSSPRSTVVTPIQSGGVESTTTTTVASGETTNARPGAPAPPTTTTTTTTEPGAAAGGGPTPPANTGLREARVGLIADYRAGMMGDMGMEGIEVLGADIRADFSMAVEAFQAGELWIAALALLIAAAVVSGMDRRRARRPL